MRGDNHLLALTTTTDEITGEVKPLFAFPVQVCAALDSTADVRFDVAAPSGAPREQLWRDSATGEIVADTDCPRGVRVGDVFHTIPQEAIDTIKEATSLKTMVALGKLPLAECLDRYAGRIVARQFLQVPSKGGSAKAYRLTYEALRAQKSPRGKVTGPALAVVLKRTAKSRQKLAFVYADENLEALVMCEVAFAAAVKSPDDQVHAFKHAAVDEGQIAKARQVVEAMSDGTLALDGEVDEAVSLKRDLIEKAVDGEIIVAPAKVAEVVEEDNLEAALAASLEAVAA